MKRRPPAPTPALSLDNCPLLTTTPSFLSSRVIMGLRPTQGDEKSLPPATTLYRTVAPSFVIPSEAEGSAVPRTFRGHVFGQSAAERRDLCVDASSWKMFFDGAKPTDLQFSLSSRTRSLTSEAVPDSTMPFLQAHGRPAYRRRPKSFWPSRGLQIQPRMDRSPAIPTGAKPRSRDNNYR